MLRSIWLWFLVKSIQRSENKKDISFTCGIVNLGFTE